MTEGGPVWLSSITDAAPEYRRLLDLGYPRDATLKLVGDRHRLGARERMILYRGVLDAGQSGRIASALARSARPGAPWAVDGYNVLFTIINYRGGHPMFLGTDGLLRDAGGKHGRFGGDDEFDQAAELMAETLAGLKAGAVTVYLDAPVSGSGRHAEKLTAALRRAGIDAEARTVRSADPPVRDFEGGHAASSDSAVAFGAHSPVFDLARCALERRYGAVFPDLGSLVSGCADGPAGAYALVTFVPAGNAEAVLEALFAAGAGALGNYERCAWTSPGRGRFRPLAGSAPHVGAQGLDEYVDEERLELLVTEAFVEPAMAALRAAHPYEEPAVYLYRLDARCLRPGALV